MEEPPPQKTHPSYIPRVKFDIPREIRETPIKTLIERNEHELKTILEHPSLFKAINEGNETLIAYLCNKMDDLLSLCLTLDDINHGLVVYSIIKMENARIVRNLAKHDKFLYLAFEILISSDPDHELLLRLANVAIIVIRACKDEFPASCGYVVQFLNILQHYCAASFFEDLLQNEPEYKAAHEWLLSIGFAEVIATEIDGTNPVGDPFSDVSTHRYTQLLKYVRLSIYCPILAQSFRCKIIIKAVLRKIDGAHPFVIEERLCTILDLYNAQTYKYFRCVYEEALHAMDNFKDKGSLSRVAGTYIVLKMILYDHEIVEHMEDGYIPGIILNIFYKNTESTELVLAAMQLAKSSIENPKLMEVVAEIVVPPLVYEAINNTNVFMRAIAFDFLNWCKEKAEENKQLAKMLSNVPNWKQFCRVALKKWLTLIEPYETD